MEKSNKKSKKIIIISIICLVIISILICIGPFLIFVGSIFWEMFINIPEAPQIEYGEFPFEIVYEYKGEKRTIKDTIVCEYEGHSFALDGGNTRDWDCYLKNNNDYGRYYIDEENEPDLYIQVPMEAEYFMGAPESNIENARPYIYYDVYEECKNLDEEELTDSIDIKIIEWKPSKPLENNFK